MNLISQGFLGISLFHGKDTFKGLFLTAKDLNLFLMGIELFLELSERIIKRV